MSFVPSRPSAASPFASGPSRRPAATVPVHVEITVKNFKLNATVQAPAAPVSPVRMLNVVQSLADTLVKATLQEAEAKGQHLSCKAGCGACCRQLVPVSGIEARRLAEVVQAMPEPRRSAVRERFADTVRQIEAAGLLDRLQHPEAITKGDVRPFGEEYFRARIPCPLLENEACSIHPDRPLICREFLVSSDPALCADPESKGAKMIPVPGKLGAAAERWERELARTEARERSTKAAGSAAVDSSTADPSTTVAAEDPEAILPWVPLPLALDWVAAHPEPQPTLTGPQQVVALLTALSGKPVALK